MIYEVCHFLSSVAASDSGVVVSAGAIILSNFSDLPSVISIYRIPRKV